MIKNINVTLSLITLIIVLFFSIKTCLAFMFSHEHEGNIKDNFYLFKKYKDNDEE